MLVKGVNINGEDAIELSKVENDFLKRREGGLLLSDYQISILDMCGINYKKYSNLSSLLFEIEEYLNDDANDELEEVSRQLSEIHYYSETNK